MISVIIPNYNRGIEVCTLIQSLNKQKHSEFEIIIVDDASADGSVSLIAREFPRIRIIPLENNQGPAVARNKGVEIARGEIIVCLDSDVVIEDEQLLIKVEELLDADSGTAILSFRLYDNTSKSDDAGRWWHPLDILQYAGHAFYTDYFTGSAFAIRKEAYLAAGKFTGYLYMHMEEVDLSLRILNCGYDIRYSPELKAVHMVSQTSRNNRIEYYYKRRNQIWIMLKYYPVLKIAAYLVPRLLLTLFRSLLKGQVITYLSCIRDAAKGVSIVLGERQVLRKETWDRIAEIKSGIVLYQVCTDENYVQ